MVCFCFVFRKARERSTKGGTGNDGSALARLNLLKKKRKNRPRATQAAGQAIWQSFDRCQKMQVLIGSRKK